jgi:beta propeller repeat protein
MRAIGLPSVMPATAALAASLVALWPAAAIAQTSVPGTITQLSSATTNKQQDSPDISGNNVVWVDNERTSSSSTHASIVRYDLSTGITSNLTNDPTSQYFLDAIRGNHVVWLHVNASKPGDIDLYDIPSGTASTIAGSNASISFSQPAVSDRFVVFIRTTSQSDVDGYDIQTGGPVPQQITNDAADQARPRVSGDLVVWEDYNGASSTCSHACARIMGYHILTEGPAFAIDGANNNISPDVEGNRVVWFKKISTGNYELMFEDLSTGIARVLTTVVANNLDAPRISGRRVIWADDSAGTLNVYSYDLPTGVEAPLLPQNGGGHFLAAIDGDSVVYTDNAGGAEHINLFHYQPQVGPPPSVKKLSPRKGQAGGGTSVTITGANFSEPASVRFGSTNATSFTVNSPTSITAVSPVGKKGTVDVSVSTLKGASTTSKKDHFKYR